MDLKNFGPINSSYYMDNNLTCEIVGESSEVKSEMDNNSGKSTDVEVNSNEIDETTVNKKELDKSLNKLNRFLEDESAHAEYSVHEDFGTVMIKIVDDNTKKVILEVPPKKILDMVASMCKQFGLIDKKA